MIYALLGFVLFFWILTPVLYYTNVWDLGNSRIHVFVLLAYNYIYLTSAIHV